MKDRESGGERMRKRERVGERKRKSGGRESVGEGECMERRMKTMDNG